VKSLVHGLGRNTKPSRNVATAPIAVERTRAKTRLVTRWQISYECAPSDCRGSRKLSTKLYEYNKARKLVARLRARGNDAYVAGALTVSQTLVDGVWVYR
jgi:hypothetical protein